MSVLEVRSYVVKPGMAAQFTRVMHEQSLPLLKAAGTEVVAFNASLHADGSFMLVRAYRDLPNRAESQEAFYASDAWRDGPRQAVLACIETYTTVVVDAAHWHCCLLANPKGSTT